MKKYYIEVYEMGGFTMQTDWFDTKEEALEWYSKISYSDNRIALMSSEFDDEDSYGDIEVEEELR